MQKHNCQTRLQQAGEFLRRLARDRAGNTLALIAAAILPLLGMVGGGIDMGRAYLAENRLQQACDSGVLAARKVMGTEVVSSGQVPDDVETFGTRFFDVNFRDGAYGTQNRDFRMTLEADYAISGVASVDVPTSVMVVFGIDKVPLSVECQARLNFPTVDVMMVLDVTGSMRHTNPGDPKSRIETLKDVIRDFHTQLEGSKASSSTVRYGFVPYATNVNVGHLLEDDWVQTDWTYQSRVSRGFVATREEQTYSRNWRFVGGNRSSKIIVESYAATFNPNASGDQASSWSCSRPNPANTLTQNFSENGDIYTEIKRQPPAVLYITPMKRIQNGRIYRTELNGSICEVSYVEHTNYTHTYEDVREVPRLDERWRYKPVEYDMSDWRTTTGGCIEERKTTQITDFSNVDLSENLDLDIDLIPSPGNPDTQWKPRNPSAIFVRSIQRNGSGSISVPEVTTTDDYADTGNWWFSDCTRAKAKKLETMTSAELDTYLATLTPYGATYHDIGMIWGARLISPSGLFADENAAADGSSVSRHIIFLTDGQTEPYDISYGAYGVDALDQRRWDPTDNSMTLAQVVEARFGFACNEVKKRNVTVWVVAFGTRVNDAMVDCAGAGQYFEAKNAFELGVAFATIARSIGDLRISR
ncbi:VWA domain-containing protein [Erythrobacter sp. HKB08]|uniref:VWA domain-containing protein n=1 Tax=Erythrobacter sp. HKB08 TaxID=2502843 RepID=UPI0013E8E6CB|nr:VWA domain-containing protein [Erythrobacter sp. HKB08]